MPRFHQAPRLRPKALLLIALLGLAEDAQSYVLEETPGGLPLHWPDNRGSTYIVDGAAPREIQIAARFAFDAWGHHLGAPVRPEYRGLSSPPALAERDGRSLVLVSDDWGYGEADRLVAYTELHYDATTGEISEADITLNEEGFDFRVGEPGAMDPKSVLLHEAGHFFGLAHSCGVPGSATPSCFSLPEQDRARVLGAVMAPSLGPGETRRALTEDDLAGLAALYPGGFIPTSSVSLSSAEGTCEAGGLVVYGHDWPDEPEAFLRHSSGERSPMSVREVSETRLRLSGLPAISSTESVDLLIVDPASGQRTSLLDIQATASGCDGGVPIAKDETGCACQSNTGGPRGLAWLISAVGLLVLRRRRASSALLVGLIIASISTEAFAYRCSRVDFDEGPSLYWAERSIGFFVDDALVADQAQNLEFRQEVTTSLAVWTQVDCSDFSLELLGFKAVRAGYNQTGDNENVITFVDASEGWPYDAAIIAVTTNTFETSSGRIIDSDIEVNDHHFDLVVVRGDGCDSETGVMDLQNTLTHEVGHVIGLDHPPNTRIYAETTMFASAPSCETKKRTLTDDDMAGLCDIYPIGQPVAQCFPPNGPLFALVEQDDGFGGCSVTGGGDAVSLGAVVLLLALMRARRRRP